MSREPSQEVLRYVKKNIEKNYYKTLLTPLPPLLSSIKVDANRSNISSNIVISWCLMKCLNGLCMSKIFSFFKKEEKNVFDECLMKYVPEHIFIKHFFERKGAKPMFERFGGLFHQTSPIWMCGISLNFTFRKFQILFE